MARPVYSIEEIKGMLLDRRHEVARHYAPPAPGSYTDKGQYFTLNPGRVDRSVGSFVVTLEGPKAGRWADYATGQFGDLIDLIELYLGGDKKAALIEARSYLGLEADSPEIRRQRQAAIERAKRHAAEAAQRDAEERQRRRGWAQRLWLSAQEKITSTPVEWYLRDARGIDLRALGRDLGALRFMAECKFQHTDRETGEVIETTRPAMLGIVVNGHGETVAVHRTWLELVGGTWSKAQLPEPKKVLGDYAGGAIHLWSGYGPRGGKGRPLSACPAGSHVYIAEGIEDALSCAVALPQARVLAAVALGNLARVSLPANVSDVTLIADRDDHPDARQQLQRAIEAHARAGRRVRVWQNAEGGKDLNDALRARLAANESQGEP